MADGGIILDRNAFMRTEAAVKFVETTIRGEPAIRRRQPRGGGSGGLVKWYKATANWSNVAGNGSFVQANPSDDYLGTTIDTDTLVNITLPRNGSLEDPNIISGAIVAASHDIAGDLVIVGDYLDGTIGKSVQVWNGTPGDLAADKPGWEIFTKPQEKFIAGYKLGSTDYGAIAATGGFDWHGGTENNHTDHCLAHTHCVSTGVNCVDVNLDASTVARFDSTDSAGANWASLNADHDGPYNTNADTDNRPPWCVLFWILRSDNAA